jgi:hypothetical protein
VLSYLSAGRAIVALLPLDNPAAADVTAAGGFVAEPTTEGAAAAGAWVVETAGDPAALESIGVLARGAAEQRFDIGSIADDFEREFLAAAGLAGVEVASACAGSGAVAAETRVDA